RNHWRLARRLHSLSAFRTEDNRGRRREARSNPETVRGTRPGRKKMSDGYILPSGRVLRYAFHERLIHWMAGLSYLYLLLTGLAFWSPWLFWLAVVVGGGT